MERGSEKMLNYKIFFSLCHTFLKIFEITVCTVILIGMEKYFEKFFSVFDLIWYLENLKAIIYVVTDPHDNGR